MDTSAILASLRAEHDRIGKAISALEALDSTGATAGRRVPRPSPAASSKPVRRRKPLTTAAKKHLSDMMKKRWAERKKKQKKP
jgi:hypothetical protein